MAKIIPVWTIKDVCEVIEGRVNNNYDCIVLVDAVGSARGVGKSSLTLKICNRLKVQMPFVMERDVLYDRLDILKHLATKKKGIIVADEIITAMYNREHWNQDQQTLIKVCNTYRDSNNTFFCILPSIMDADKQLLKLCAIRITIVTRGIALIQTPIKTMFQSDTWDLKNNQKIESAWAMKGTKNPRWGQLTTVRGILYFGKLTEEQETAYKKLKEEKRGRLFSQYGDQTIVVDADKLFYDNLLTEVKAGKLTTESLTTLIKVSGKKQDVVRNRLNKILQEQGDTKRMRDYVLSEKKKERINKPSMKIAYGKPIDIPIGQQMEVEQDDGQEQSQEESSD